MYGRRAFALLMLGLGGCLRLADFEETCLVDYCNGECIDLTSDERNCGFCGLGCSFDEDCHNGRCLCRSGEQCGSGCVDVASDENNCGACGAHCPFECVNGTCLCQFTVCPSGCFDLENDPDHCGSCANNCPGTLLCVEGECVCGNPQLTPCPPAYFCVDTQISEYDCGTCGIKCSAGEICIEGVCN